jgi:hypothetical protein
VQTSRNWRTESLQGNCILLLVYSFQQMATFNEVLRLNNGTGVVADELLIQEEVTEEFFEGLEWIESD